MIKNCLTAGISLARPKSGLAEILLLLAMASPAWMLPPSTLAVGQESGSVDTKPQTRSAFRRSTVSDQVKRLAKALDLSETQQSEVKRILGLQQEQSRRIRTDPSIPGADRINRFRALQDRTVVEIRAVLNEDQKKKYNPRALREAQQSSPQLSVEDWMKATTKNQ